MEPTFSPLLGIAIAAFLGGAIGLQREAAQKPAGFRTHLIVAAASAAFTAMGAHLHDTRIPSYIVVGIGFLGAGAIVREGGTPHGLTSAASIWMAAAVGLVLGFANWFGLSIGLFVTVITLLALAISDRQLMQLFHIAPKATLRISCDAKRTSLPDIAAAFQQAGAHFESAMVTTYTSEGESGIVEIAYNVELRHGRDLSVLIRQLSELPGVQRIETKEPLGG